MQSDDDDDDDDDDDLMDIDDEDDDPSFYAKTSVKKQTRPPFKADAYRRLALKHKVVKCDGTEALIKGRKPHWKFLHNQVRVYLTGDYKEMRSDKPPTEWKRIDKDHEIDFVALFAAAKEVPKWSPSERDSALLLASRSTKHLRFLPRNVHKKKATFRRDSISAPLRKKAIDLLRRKHGKLNMAKYKPLFNKLKAQHDKGVPPSWSVENN